MSEVVPPDILVGIDTHKHVHAAVAITALGARLGELSFPVSPEGCRRLAAWARSLGKARAFGIEGTGSYGAGLARFLRGAAMWSTRSAVLTAGCAASTARPTTSTPRVPPAPCSPGRPPPCRSRAPAGSR